MASVGDDLVDDLADVDRETETEYRGEHRPGQCLNERCAMGAQQGKEARPSRPRARRAGDLVAPRDQDEHASPLRREALVRPSLRPTRSGVHDLDVIPGPLREDDVVGQSSVDEAVSNGGNRNGRQRRSGPLDALCAQAESVGGLDQAEGGRSRAGRSCQLSDAGHRNVAPMVRCDKAKAAGAAIRQVVLLKAGHPELV